MGRQAMQTGRMRTGAARRPGNGSLILTGVALVASILLAGPAPAAPRMSEAESLRRLDIMLMVTQLRCRASRDNFTREYGRFTRRHLATLNAAQAELGAQLARRHGQRGGKRALDRVNVHMANDYGQGHPWLGCRELKRVAKRLAKVKERGELARAASELLSRRQPRRLAYAKP